MLTATVKNLKDGFHTHYDFYKRQTNKNYSSTLLLTYAVECGLKSYILKANHLRTSESFGDKGSLKGCSGKNGHHLAMLAEKSEGCPKICSHLRLKNDGQSTSIDRFHEALRYNIEIDDEDYDCIVGKLEEIAAWLDSMM